MKSDYDNIVLTKSKAFAVRCVNLHKYLFSHREIIDISRQMVRSGTSIGANIQEGAVAQSKADFIAKLSISLKEAKETLYWLEILSETHYLTPKQAESMITDCKELIYLLTTIIKSSRNAKNGTTT